MQNFVELPILGVLRERSLHGYDLKHRIESLPGFFGTLSFGSLYPMLRQLELREHVTSTKGAQSGRTILRYRITTKGERRFFKLINDPGIALTQKLLFFNAVRPNDRMQILRAHLAEWKDRLTKYRTEQKRTELGEANRYQAALLARQIQLLEKDVAWLRKLIRDESRM